MHKALVILAYALGLLASLAGRGVAKDPARGAALLKDACDGGVACSCDRIARP